jgi:hypothetical protein
MVRFMPGRTGKAWIAVLAVSAGMLAACGSASQPEAVSAMPLTAASVSVTQTGNAQAKLVATSVSYKVDLSGSLVIQLSVTSTATSPQTVMVRASLFNAPGTLIGDAQGSATQVAPGATVAMELNGPAPNGTIASATFEITNTSAPAPAVTTPIPT